MPGNFEDVQALTPFGTVYRYDDLPMDDTPDRRSWPPLLHDLQAFVEEASAMDDRFEHST
jgi:hypothetical protein